MMHKNNNSNKHLVVARTFSNKTTRMTTNRKMSLRPPRAAVAPVGIKDPYRNKYTPLKYYLVVAVVVAGLAAVVMDFNYSQVKRLPFR